MIDRCLVVVHFGFHKFQFVRQAEQLVAVDAHLVDRLFDHPGHLHCLSAKKGTVFKIKSLS